jgi:hypothetical protein
VGLSPSHVGSYTIGFTFTVIITFLLGVWVAPLHLSQGADERADLVEGNTSSFVRLVWIKVDKRILHNAVELQTDAQMSRIAHAMDRPVQFARTTKLTGWAL